MKNPILLFILFSLPSKAASFDTRGFAVTIEPVLGYEFSERDSPTRHRAGMLLYGGRFTAGKPHFSMEGEYTQGSSTEAFTSPSVQTIETRKDSARIGIRATAALSNLLASYLRLGGQASKVKTTTIDLSGVSIADRDWQYKPYLGAGFQLRLAGALSAGIDANYVFYSLQDFSANSVQLNGSIRILLGGK
jgi:hypothetical protein